VALVSLALAPGVLAVAGCGGNSDADAAKTAVNTFIETGRHPTAKLCDVISQRFIEERTHLQGQAALEKCRTNAAKAGAAGRGATFPANIKLTDVKVTGGKADVTATAPGQKSGVFHMVKEGGKWKVDSATG
jgi:hypothetical protein